MIITSQYYENYHYILRLLKQNKTRCYVTFNRFLIEKILQIFYLCSLFSQFWKFQKRHRRLFSKSKKCNMLLICNTQLSNFRSFILKLTTLLSKVFVSIMFMLNWTQNAFHLQTYVLSAISLMLFPQFISNSINIVKFI